jgi:Spy/CpxP family protein refolding chaperone
MENKGPKVAISDRKRTKAQTIRKLMDQQGGYHRQRERYNAANEALNELIQSSQKYPF